MKKNKLLFTGSAWTEEKIMKTWKVIEKIATEQHGLTFFQPQFEITDYDTMLINHSVTSGLPVIYSHWSQGRAYIAERDAYLNRQTGLAYELILNSDPAITYLMNSNSMPMMALVLAHAAVGHSSMFKNNFKFKEGVSPQYIVPFMSYARDYVELCEARYGESSVCEILDAAHSIENQSMDYKKSRKVLDEYLQRINYNKELERNYKEEYKDFDHKKTFEDIDEGDLTGDRIILPESNLLYFIEKTSPTLQKWEREILRIVRMKAQYFSPIRHTKLMHEGYASFWHYILTNDLYDQGYIDEGAMLEILHSHTNVCCQQDMVQTYRMNPYKLGSEIFFDIKRMCLEPTKEDYEWFPDLAGSKDWHAAIQFAMENFTDESFILQYLSPAVVRKLGLMQLNFEEAIPYSRSDMYLVNSIQSNEDFKKLRLDLSTTYNVYYHTPLIQVVDYDTFDDVLHLKNINMFKHTLDVRTKREIEANIGMLMGPSCEVYVSDY